MQLSNPSHSNFGLPKSKDIAFFVDINQNKTEGTAKSHLVWPQSRSSGYMACTIDLFAVLATIYRIPKVSIIVLYWPLRVHRTFTAAILKTIISIDLKALHKSDMSKYVSSLGVLGYRLFLTWTQKHWCFVEELHTSGISRLTLILQNTRQTKGWINLKLHCCH